MNINKPVISSRAGWGRRLAAFFLDVFLVSLFFMVSAFIFFQAGLALTAVLFLIYWVVVPARSGQTLGKRGFSIRIVRLGHRELGYVGGGLRLLGYGLNLLTLGAGFLMAFFRKDRRGLHDLLAGTQVVAVEAQPLILPPPTPEPSSPPPVWEPRPTPSAIDVKIYLERLKNLYRKGILTEKEYEEQREKFLNNL